MKSESYENNILRCPHCGEEICLFGPYPLIECVCCGLIIDRRLIGKNGRLAEPTQETDDE